MEPEVYLSYIIYWVAILALSIYVTRETKRREVKESEGGV